MVTGMSEAQHARERRPLLPDNDDIENMPVYPIIHMIRQVSCYDFSAFRA